MDYKIIRSKRKTISIEIKKDKTVTVRAPLRATDEYIEKVVKSKQSWIEKHLESISEYAPEPTDEPDTYDPFNQE